MFGNFFKTPLRIRNRHLIVLAMHPEIPTHPAQFTHC